MVEHNNEDALKVAKVGFCIENLGIVLNRIMRERMECVCYKWSDIKGL